MVCYHAALAAVVAARPGNRFAGFAGLGLLAPVIGRFFLALPAFFVLSGYLIGRPFVTAYLEGGAQPRLGPYLRNRALRIVPAFWLAYVAVLVLVGHGPGPVSPAAVMAGMGFAQNYRLDGVSGLLPQAWSIDVEVGFYLLWPLAVLALAKVSAGLTRRGRSRVLVVSLLAAMLASVALRSAMAGSPGWLLSPLATAYVFVPGLLLATLEPGAAGRPPGRRVGKGALAGSGWARRLVWVLAGTGVAGMIGDAVLTPPRALVIPGLLVGPRPLIETLAMGALIAALLVRQWHRGDCPRWLDNRPIRWVGERSYSLYLVHIAVLTELGRVLPAHLSALEALVILAGAGVPISLVIADLGYRLVERPFSRLRAARPATLPTPLVTLAVPAEP